jgi:hypothetical protein
MRSVNITGKHNIDELKKIDNAYYKPVRRTMIQFDETFINHAKQVQLIGEVYMDYGQDSDKNNDIIKSRLKSELLNKIQGYKAQDLSKDIYNAGNLITLEDLLEKLVGSKLLCCYCSKPLFVFYKNVREPTQWTLDRIDNNLSHTKENTCVSCLKCNLQRRCMDAKKFTFTKKLKINKV